MFSSLQNSQEQENLKVSNMDCGDHVNSTWIVEGLQAVLITQVCGFCFFSPPPAKTGHNEAGGLL